MSNQEWTGSILESTGGLTFSKEEYDLLVSGDFLGRITRDRELLGFYVSLDELTLDLKSESKNEEVCQEDLEVINGILKKLSPFEKKGKYLFLP